MNVPYEYHVLYDTYGPYGRPRRRPWSMNPWSAIDTAGNAVVVNPKMACAVSSDALPDSVVENVGRPRRTSMLSSCRVSCSFHAPLQSTAPKNIGAPSLPTPNHGTSFVEERVSDPISNSCPLSRSPDCRVSGPPLSSDAFMPVIQRTVAAGTVNE